MRRIRRERECPEGWPGPVDYARWVSPAKPLAAGVSRVHEYNAQLAAVPFGTVRAVDYARLR